MVLADRGFYDGKELLACDQAGITAYVPKCLASGAKAVRKTGLRLQGGRGCLSLPCRRALDVPLLPGEGRQNLGTAIGRQPVPAVQ
jgi:hypothetical protein